MRSGLYNGLFWSGAFFLLCALIRRMRGRNWLVALPYIWRWNTVLLGSLLFWFRFTLVLTIILIPQSLAIHGFEADQIGPAIIWSAAPLLLVALTGGLLMLSGLDPRLLFAAGSHARRCRLSCALTTRVRGRQKTIIAPSCSPGSDKPLLL